MTALRNVGFSLASIANLRVCLIPLIHTSIKSGLYSAANSNRKVAKFGWQQPISNKASAGDKHRE